MAHNIIIDDNLKTTTAMVFDLCAKLYLNEDSHWQKDTKVILPLLTSHCSQIILDAGCGPGWHLEWLMQHVSQKSIITGIDYSQEMLNLARIRINKYPSIENVTLTKADLLSVMLNKNEYDLVFCLNNTFGNICGESIGSAYNERVKLLKKFSYILKPNGGRLVISVYNRNGLSDSYNYGEVFKLDKTLSNLDKGDLVVRYLNPPITPDDGIPYFSHWFTIAEIRNVLQDNNIDIINIYESSTNICVIGKKGGSPQGVNKIEH